MVSAVSPPIMTRNVGLKGFQPLAIDRRMRPMKLNGGPASHGRTQPMRPTGWGRGPRGIETIIFFSRGKESNSRQVFALNLLLNLYNIQYNASASQIRKLLRNTIAKT